MHDPDLQKFISGKAYKSFDNYSIYSDSIRISIFQ